MANTATTQQGPSRQVLAGIPARAVVFLGAAGKSRPIRALLASRGYTAKVHQEGWTLLHAASGFVSGDKDQTEDHVVGGAIAELDALDEPLIRIVRASLERGHEAQADFVCKELEPQVGAAAVVSIQTLLDRLDALESDPERTATRDADLAALAKLEARGLPKKERARLRELVDIASGAAMDDPIGSEEGAGELPVADSKEHLAALMELYGWYKEWSEIARVVVKRRDFLIRLGLAHRKPAKKAAPKKAAPKEAEAKKAEPKEPAP